MAKSPANSPASVPVEIDYPPSRVRANHRVDAILGSRISPRRNINNFVWRDSSVGPLAYSAFLLRARDRRESAIEDNLRHWRNKSVTEPGATVANYLFHGLPPCRRRWVVSRFSGRPCACRRLRARCTSVRVCTSVYEYAPVYK